MSTCQREHTDFQPDVWTCPTCGEVDDFVNQGSFEGEDCPRLHVDDIIICYSCGGDWTGQELAEVMAET